MDRRPPPPLELARGVAAFLAAVGLGFLVWAGVVAVLLSFLGCATGRARVAADRTVDYECIALLKDARFVLEVPAGEGGVLTSAPKITGECQGGDLVPAVIETLGSVGGAALKFVGGLIPWAALF